MTGLSFADSSEFYQCKRNAVANSRQEYLYRLQVAVQALHKCEALHRQTVPVNEDFDGQTWEGLVEVFDLAGHPTAKRVYAWSQSEGPNDEGGPFVVVLEIPPVDSAKAAVRVQIGEGGASTPLH